MFISDSFTFNGKRSSDFNVSLVDFDSSVLNDIGIAYTRDISRDDGSSSNPTYNVNDGEGEDLVLNMILLDFKGNASKWDNNTLTKVKNWLITDDFAQFTSDDNPNYIYYVQCSKIVNKFTFDMEGVLEVTFKLFSCYAYQTYQKNLHINRSSDALVVNPTNKPYYPVIEVTNLGDVGTINKINDLTLTGLDTNETVKVDNLMLTVLNGDKNRLSCCNRSWIKLNPGDNILTVSGNCAVKILAEFPVIV